MNLWYTSGSYLEETRGGTHETIPVYDSVTITPYTPSASGLGPTCALPASIPFSMCFIMVGTNWTVQFSALVNTTSVAQMIVATTNNQLSQNEQAFTVVSATGTRVFTNLSTGVTSATTVTGLSPGFAGATQYVYYGYPQQTDWNGIAFTMSGNVVIEGEPNGGSTFVLWYQMAVGQYLEETASGRHETTPTFSSLSFQPYSGVPTPCQIPLQAQQIIYYSFCSVIQGATWQSVMSGTLFLSNVLLLESDVTGTLAPAYYVVGANGTRTFTGNTTQVATITGVATPRSSTGGPDNFLFIRSPTVLDGDGITFTFDVEPIIQGEPLGNTVNHEMNWWFNNPFYLEETKGSTHESDPVSSTVTIAPLLSGLPPACPASSAPATRLTYSSWAQSVFPDLTSYPAVAPTATVNPSGVDSTVNIAGVVTGPGLGGTPFQSVYGVPVRVSASTNLAFPFTGTNQTNHVFVDADTGIDVLAGGIVTFRSPATGTGSWCYELGRSLAGQSACTGPAGYAFDYYNYPCFPSSSSPCGQQKCQNSMINGAWNTTDTPQGTSLPQTQRGTAFSFTYARSGALMARIGAQGQSNEALNVNPNDPVGEYFSALDFVSKDSSQCASAVLTPPTATTGILNQYVAVSSGRLYMAIFRWNFFPSLANGTISILVDYQSPLQVAVSSSSIGSITAGSTSNPVVLTTLSSATLPTTVVLPTAAITSISVSGLLPVLNITGLSLNPSTAGVSPFLNASQYTFMGPINQVSQGGANAQNGENGPWLSAYQQPAVRLANTFTANTGTVGVDLSAITSSNQYGFIFPAINEGMPLNPYLQQYYPPCSPDYDCEYDSGINVIEGGTITLFAAAAETWCFASDWSDNNPSSVCSNAQGATFLPYLWNGCSGQFHTIYPNASQFGWTPTNNAYDNSGCNSDSDLQAPVGAVVFRIGVDTTGMKHAGYLPVESHSFDYFYAFPNPAVAGDLYYTFTAPNSGRLYLASQVPGGSAGLFNGTIHVTASYTPPPGLVLGVSWTPSPSNVQQPYLFPAPTINTPSLLSAAGLQPSTAPTFLPIPDSFTGVAQVNATFWVYQPVFTSPVKAPAQSGYLCFIFYSLPGNVDYPWSSAISLQFLYDSTPIVNAIGTAVNILSGQGTRTFTNRFGVTVVTPFNIATPSNGAAPNLLYTSTISPVDANGLSLNLSSPVQLPGYGPSILYNTITIYNQSGIVVESSESKIDRLGSAFLSTVPGFTNQTIGASNLNSLAPNYATCQAIITFTNGLRVPTQPSVSNSAMRFSFSYFISDGVSYSVQANLTVSAATQFAGIGDQLGNPYQTIVNITGSRLYTYLPTSQTVLSAITGLSTAVNPLADQRFYPYSFLAASPGVYTINTAPFLDYNGLEFSISPSAPADGAAPSSGPQYSAIQLYITTPEPTAVLTESGALTLPVVTYQQQQYTFLA